MDLEHHQRDNGYKGGNMVKKSTGKMPQALIDKWNKGKKAPVKGAGKAKGVKAGGLTAKQKKLPPALQKAILRKKGGK